MLQEGNRFCPFCFEDQFATTDLDIDAGTASPIDPQVGIAAANEARIPVVIDFSDTVQPDADEVIQVPGPTGDAGHGTDPEIGLLRPDSVWHTEVLGEGRKEHWAARFATPQRLVIAIAAALVLIALVFMGIESVYFDDHNEAGRLRAFQADVQRARAALSGGDLNAAEQLLDELDVEHGNDPAVQTLREAFEQRLQAQAAAPEPLPDLPLKASRALRVDDSPAPPPSPPPQSAPAPATGAPAAEDPPTCSETLAALALCQKK